MTSVSLQVLTSPGCSHCEAFISFWEKERATWPNVAMKEISILTPEGQAAALRYQVFASPGIVINDELFDSGGFNKSDLLKKLSELSH